ncbi:hypothetical protein TIFTF001_036694 [Ficus carica]|uniref:Uncharacterized protein n=1 Tax=Ficus carica TaxID=3494 RepID=A0AA88E7E1_FICCA|nr:hypothetical protein TIFTF001_036694 [Ficus carica]
MDLTSEEDAVAVRMAGQPSTSGRGEGSDEEFESSGSTTPWVNPSRLTSNRPVWINGILDYQMADMEMVDRAGGRPMYTVDYFTIAITPEYLELLWEEF